jgi:LCP family protein required for cell wall assembly
MPNNDLWRPRPLLSIFAALLFLTALIFFWPQISKLAKPRLIEVKNYSSQKLLTVESSWAFWPDKQTENLTFLLLGAAGEGNDAPDLTDTILLAYYVPTQEKIFLFSLPRDLLVKIPDGDNYTKLNALYAINKKSAGHEFDLILQKAQEISGLTINHYVLVDLQVVEKIVDALGGVNVLVKEDIKDESFPGPNHSYQTFELPAGWRYLNGQTALKYIRSRHSVGGDFDRIVRQQEILGALKQKVLALNFWDLGTLFNTYQTLANNIKTDLGLWKIQDLWQDIKDIPGENIIKNELTDENLLTTGSAIFGEETASIVKPQAGVENYDEIKNYIQSIISN